MAKSVFRPGEVALINQKVVLEAPFPEIEDEEIEEIPVLNTAEVYTGPTADDIRREAELYKAHWSEEKENMLSGARAEAEVLVTDARITAQKELETTRSLIEKEKAEAQEKAEAIIAEAEKKAKQLEAHSAVIIEEAKQAGINDGKEQGLKDGYDEGMAEVNRLIARTHLILEKIQDKRTEILTDAEQQIINLVLMISRKVIKTIAETQRDVVVENIKEALGKVKNKCDVIVKVNMLDLDISSARKEEFNKLIESGSSIQIYEDSSVDAGGCIIETDFGGIDARIASQLAEIETKILALSPIK